MLLGFLYVFGIYSKYFAIIVPLYDICYVSAPMFIFSIEHSILFHHINTPCINKSLRTTGILQSKWPKTQKDVEFTLTKQAGIVQWILQ